MLPESKHKIVSLLLQKRKTLVMDRKKSFETKKAQQDPVKGKMSINLVGLYQDSKIEEEGVQTKGL